MRTFFMYPGVAEVALDGKFFAGFRTYAAGVFDGRGAGVRLDVAREEQQSNEPTTGGVTRVQAQGWRL